MYLQEIKQSSVSIFDDKRKYLNNIKCLPWNGRASISFYKGGGKLIDGVLNVIMLEKNFFFDREKNDW